jgi:hypothetical protein
MRGWWRGAGWSLAIAMFGAWGWRITGWRVGGGQPRSRARWVRVVRVIAGGLRCGAAAGHARVGGIPALVRQRADIVNRRFVSTVATSRIRRQRQRTEAGGGQWASADSGVQNAMRGAVSCRLPLPSAGCRDSLRFCVWPSLSLLSTQLTAGVKCLRRR